MVATEITEPFICPDCFKLVVLGEWHKKDCRGEGFLRELGEEDAE